MTADDDDYVWMDITITVSSGADQSGDDDATIITMQVTPHQLMPGYQTTMHNVPRTVDDIIRSCNGQHNVVGGGEHQQLLLDYDRCRISLNGTHEPSAHSFVKCLGDQVSAGMVRHTVALCTQGVLADFYAHATHYVNASHSGAGTKILVDHHASNIAPHTCTVSVIDPTHVNISIAKSLCIYCGDHIRDTGDRLTMNIDFYLRRGAYTGRYRFHISAS
jgi:hypothetical protein